MAKMIPVLWFLVGVMNNVGGTSWNEFLLYGVQVSPSDKALLGVVEAFPWNLKICAAFLSDVRPICGRRRVPYLIMGLLMQGSCWIALGLVGNSMTFPLICLQQFVSTMGQMLTGVMCDTLVVENIRHETGETVGRLQSNTYLMFAVGGLVGTLLSGWLPQYGHIPTTTMFLIVGIGKSLLVVLVVPFLRDPKIARDRGATAGAVVGKAWDGVWSTVKLFRVFKPLVFIFVFSMMPSNSTSFNSYVIQGNPICEWNSSSHACHGHLLDDDDKVMYGSFCSGVSAAESCNKQYGGLSFTESMFSYIGLLGSVGSAFGSFLFRVWLIRTQWHCMFASTVVIASIFSAMQLPLMLRTSAGQTLNEAIHLPNLLFALGDDVVMAAANQLLALPINILMARLCPEGAEGTVYAIVTSVQGVGGTVGGVWSKLAVQGFGVENYDWSRFWQLTLLTSLAKFAVLPLLPLVPRNISDTHNSRSSVWVGLATGALFFGGLTYALYDIVASLLA
jgi:hypothetical protein